MTDAPSENGSVVVALVCSAGGLDALIRVLRPLPRRLSAAIVVLQHQSPVHPSRLAEILGTRCPLPVHVVSPGEPLRSGTVAVIPEGTHALVAADRSLRLVTAGPAPPARPSADLLLATLALAVGRDAVAVVLSGSGQDGATGATAVHELGGTVIAADPASCAYPEMPRSVIARDDVVDVALPVDEIAAAITGLVEASGRAPAELGLVTGI